MKNLFARFRLAATMGGLLISAQLAPAQSSAFTYQGQLQNSGSPANGSYDLTFTLYNASTNGILLAGPVTNTAVSVSNGLFTVAVDFGISPYTLGQAVWLQIGARTNGAATFSTLSPSQPVLSTPIADYALAVNSANLLGQVTDANLAATFTSPHSFNNAANSFTGNGSGLASVNAALLGGSSSAAFWNTNGNTGANPASGAFLGTSDNFPLELHVNGQRAFRVEPTTDTPNVIGGYSGNAAGSGAYGAVIAGGGRLGNPQTASGNYSSILGGIGNVASGTYSMVVGVTSMATNYGAVAMGDTAVSGGVDSLAIGSHTLATGAASLALGFYASATHDGSFVFADSTSSSGFGSTALNQFLIRAGGGVGINTTTPAATLEVNGSAQIDGAVTATSFTGSGSGLASLNASNLAAGTVSDLRLSSNVALRAGGNHFTGLQTITNLGYGFQHSDGTHMVADYLDSLGGRFGTVTADPLGFFVNSGYPSVTINTNGYMGVGTTTPVSPLQVNGTITASGYAGPGTGLTGVAMLAGGNTFNGNQIVTSGDVGIGITAPVAALDVGGSGWFRTNSNGLAASAGKGVRVFVDTLNTNGSIFAYDYANSAPLNLALQAPGGKVGIGTETPTKATLEIESQSGSLPGYSSGGSLSDTGAGTGSVTAGNPASIWALGGVVANSFFAFSDERIKNIQGQSDSSADLKTLMSIKVTDYTYKDTMANGNRPRKKVIAQQVEKVYPQAVSQSQDDVPDIYKRAAIQDGWVQLATDLKVGERVKLMTAKQQGVYPVLEVRDGAFRTDFKPAADNVFVYGRQVDDFRTVDYEAISMLNVSATQELARKLDAQQAALAKLQEKLNQTLAEKETLLQHLAALEARDQARENRLARLESGLDKETVHAAYASLPQP